MEEPSESSSSAKQTPDEPGSDESVDPVDDDLISGMVTTMEIRRAHLALEPDVEESSENDLSNPPLPPLRTDPIPSTENLDSARGDRQETQDFTGPSDDDTEIEHQPILLNGVAQPRPAESTPDEQRPANAKPANKRLGRPPSSAVQAAKAAEMTKPVGPRDDALHPGSAAKLGSNAPTGSPVTKATTATEDRAPKLASSSSKGGSKVATFARAAGYAAVTFLALMGMAALGYAVAVSDILN